MTKVSLKDYLSLKLGTYDSLFIFMEEEALILAKFFHKLFLIKKHKKNNNIHYTYMMYNV